MTNYIFVIGGVLSGVGKGVSAASIGALLKARGYSIFVQKLDPYLNQDPGTMSPLQHGEVFVTQDGGETDLDLGHYERFIGTPFDKDSNYTSGCLYQEIFLAERQGKYDGKTVQVIPHVTDLITQKIKNAATKHKVDFIIIEIGGTVGDIESQPFIHAISNFSAKNSFYIHTTYVPYLNASYEYKTKPTQHSLQSLRSYGISPNAIILRSTTEIPKEQVAKVAIFSGLKKNAIINLPDVDSIHKLPLIIERNKFIQEIEKHFNLPPRKPDLKDWEEIEKLVNLKKSKTITIGMVGKYTELHDAYLSIMESILIASIYAKTKVKFEWIDSSKITLKSIEKIFKPVDGIIILPGFGPRGFHGKILVADYFRDKKIPVLGICYGMQAMTIVQAHKKGIEDATSSEIEENGTYVVDLIRGKNKNDNRGGTLRLGNWECELKPGTLAQKIYGSNKIVARHRHRYEINPHYVKQIEDNDFIFSGINPQSQLAEIAEYKKHPFYIGVQYHPEFTTTVLSSNPLFDAFISATLKSKK